MPFCALYPAAHPTGAPKIFRMPTSRVFSAFLERLQVRGRRKRYAMSSKVLTGKSRLATTRATLMKDSGRLYDYEEMTFA